MNTTSEQPDVDFDSISYIDPSWPFQLFSELFSIPTFVLFVALSIQHYRKGFNGTFQKLVYITILNDMWTYYCAMFMMRWPQMGVFGFYEHVSPTIFPSLFTYCCVVSICLQHLLVLLAAINRMHSLYAPVQFTTFWDNHFFKLIIIVFLIPQPLSVYVACRGALYQKFARDTAFLNSIGMAEIPGKVVLYSTVVVCVVTVTFNVLSIVKLFIWKSSRDTPRAGQHNIKFHFYSTYTFVAETIYNLSQFGIHLFRRGTFPHSFCIIASNVFLDIFCLSSVWIWLWMSTEARQMLWKNSTKIKTST